MDYTIMLVGLPLFDGCYNFQTKGKFTYLQQKKKLSAATPAFHNNLAAL